VKLVEGFPRLAAIVEPLSTCAWVMRSSSPSCTRLLLDRSAVTRVPAADDRSRGVGAVSA